jgi:hypothetical protein
MPADKTNKEVLSDEFLLKRSSLFKDDAGKEVRVVALRGCLFRARFEARDAGGETSRSRLRGVHEAEKNPRQSDSHLNIISRSDRPPAPRRRLGLRRFASDGKLPSAPAQQWALQRAWDIFGGSEVRLARLSCCPFGLPASAASSAVRDSSHRWSCRRANVALRGRSSTKCRPMSSVSKLT